jgi:hypothetical protein
LGETGSKIVSGVMNLLGRSGISIGLGGGGQSQEANAANTIAAFKFDLGEVGEDIVTRWLLVGYDDEYSINYFGKKLRPYWRREGMDGPALMCDSAYRYEELRERCIAFDEELMADLRKAGGEKYALMCALAYRQCQAGNKLAADDNGQPLLFPKENTSNGCIGTVDVIYPMAPQFLLFGPSLTKAMLVSNLDYADSPRWKFPFAPHDLGTYPKATAQVYGGGERSEENQMPVEETGNMLILVAALAQMEGNADSGWKDGPGGFGTAGTPGAAVRTEWRTGDIWLRRQFMLPEGQWKNLHLNIHHDEDAEVYVNGITAASMSSYTTSYDLMAITEGVRAVLKPGMNMIAVHCHQTGGGQYIDVGIVDVIEQEPVKKGDSR